MVHPDCPCYLTPLRLIFGESPHRAFTTARRELRRCRLFCFCGASYLPQTLIWSVAFLMQIIVRDNNVDQALRALKKKLQREGVYREMKLRRHYEKPSEKRAREKAAAVRRARKMDRKRQERDGVK